jgi:hypothetical protein
MTRGVRASNFQQGEVERENRRVWMGGERAYEGRELGGVLKFAALETFTIALPMSESRLGAGSKAATAVRGVSTLLPGLIAAPESGVVVNCARTCGRQSTRHMSKRVPVDSSRTMEMTGALLAVGTTLEGFQTHHARRVWPRATPEQPSMHAAARRGDGQPCSAVVRARQLFAGYPTNSATPSRHATARASPAPGRWA